MWWSNKPPWWWNFEYWNKTWLEKRNIWFWITLEEAKESIKRRTEQIQCHCWLCIYCKERQKK